MEAAAPAVEEWKKKPTLKTRGKSLQEFQHHSLWPPLCAALHLGMRSVYDQLSFFIDTIEDLDEMRLLSRLVALHAFGALIDVYSS